MFLYFNLMKKILILLAMGITFSWLDPVGLQAQSFQKGSLVITANYGFDAYSIKQSTRLYNVPNSNSDTTTGAAGTNWNIEAEYGLLNWLGVGIHLKLDNYITSYDSANHYKPTAIGFEGGVLINIHIIRTQHFDLLAGCNLGFSTFTYTFDVFNDQVYGSGSWTDLHLSTRFYFGRFGLNLNFYRPEISYPNLTTNNSNIGLGESVLTSWLGTGGGASIGIQYRIIN